jgi:zinc protease
MSVALKPEAATGTSARIRTVTTRSGVSAWLVEEHAVPVIAIEIAFRGGSAQDPAGKEGLSVVMAGLLDEGAGDLKAGAFQEEIETHAVELGFGSGKDSISASMRTLARKKDEAFRLLGLALAKPRFDEDAIERVCSQIIAGLKREQNDPGSVSGKAFMARAFSGHPYGRPDRGTFESLAAITRDDLLALHSRIITRQDVKISVVGAITEAELVDALDRVFGPLAEAGARAPVALAAMAGLGETSVLPIDIPQSTIRFGSPGILRADDDFIPASVMNHILGGGSFTSRLWQEVREKRGLAYSVSSSVMAYDKAGLFFGGTATKNERAREALDVIKGEIARMLDSGPTEDELGKAKRYLVGSYALRFDTSGKIAGQLTQLQLEGLDPGYIDRRNGLFEAVGMEDVRRAAARVLAPDRLLVTVAGKPEGL